MLSVKEVSKKWNLTERRVAALCKSGKIDGAVKVGHMWQIPENVEKPSDGRVRKGLYIKKGEKLRLPIGIVDYKETISNHYYYVDKTLLIRDFIDELPKVVLFTRPRRFGKTLTMNMLKTYFEKSDEDTSIYFRKQAIWQCGKKYRDLQGRFPVIYLSFKDIKKQSWDDTFEGLRNLISAEFIRHKELDTSDKIEQKDLYRRIAGRKGSRDDYEMSLKILSAMLREHHGVSPMIIIDEYDVPIQQGYFSGFYNDVILFMRNLFSGAFKDNENLSYGFLTGILRVTKESIFSGLNNLTISSVLDEKYNSYFGFTADEVKRMAAYYGDVNKYDEICSWYDGYDFGGKEIFNPWSVINYFSNGCRAQAYWQSTGSNEIIGDILENADTEVIDNLTKLMRGGSLSTYVDTGVIYPEVKRNPSTIYSFLLMAGYLKAKDVSISNTGDYVCSVSIPNREISYVYNKEILQRLDPIIPSGIAVSIQASLHNGDVRTLKSILLKLLYHSVSYYDTAKESFYHGFMLGLCVLMGQYFVSSNRESGNGRFDILLSPRTRTLPGIIIELKAADKGDALAELASKAVQQIKEKKYYSALETRTITQVMVYGVAFCGQDVEIAFNELEN